MLFAKSVILMSKVKAFNGRFRTKCSIGDPEIVQPVGMNVDQETMRSAKASPSTIDPRQTPGFKTVENLIIGFVDSFPSSLRTLAIGDTTDFGLMTAHLVPKMYCLSFGWFVATFTTKD